MRAPAISPLKATCSVKNVPLCQWIRNVLLYSFRIDRQSHSVDPPVFGRLSEQTDQNRFVMRTDRSLPWQCGQKRMFMGVCAAGLLFVIISPGCFSFAGGQTFRAHKSRLRMISGTSRMSCTGHRSGICEGQLVMALLLS